MPAANPGTDRAVVVLIDTNILLDVALARTPWAEEAALLLDQAARGSVHGFVASHAVSTLYYIVARARGRPIALSAITDVLSILDVVALDSDDFQRALTLRLNDYEDAMHASACLRVGADYLVTRNPKDFASAPVVSRTAGQILALLKLQR